MRSKRLKSGVIYVRCARMKWEDLDKATKLKVFYLKKAKSANKIPKTLFNLARNNMSRWKLFLESNMDLAIPDVPDELDMIYTFVESNDELLKQIIKHIHENGEYESFIRAIDDAPLLKREKKRIHKLALTALNTPE